MNRLALLVLPLCLLAACGGGDNEPARNSAAIEEYKPDFSNPVGATDAFARAIEDQDLELIELALAPEEREEALPLYKKNFEVTKQYNGDWQLEFEPGSYIDDNHTVTRATYIQFENGEEKARKQLWTVFKKVKDGTWRYSPAASRRYAEEVERQTPPGNEPPANSD